MWFGRGRHFDTAPCVTVSWKSSKPSWNLRRQGAVWLMSTSDEPLKDYSGVHLLRNDPSLSRQDGKVHQRGL